MRSRCALQVAASMLGTKVLMPELSDAHVTANCEILQLTLMQHAAHHQQQPSYLHSWHPHLANVGVLLLWHGHPWMEGHHHHQ